MQTNTLNANTFCYILLLVSILAPTCIAQAQPLTVNVDTLQCERQNIFLACQIQDEDVTHLAARRTKDGMCFFVDSDRKPLNKQIYNECNTEMRAGVVRVCIMQNGARKCGLAELDGSYRVPPEYDDIRTPSEGLIAVKQEDGWGFITLDAKVILPLEHESVSPFQNGLAKVEKLNADYSSTILFIDTRGKPAFSVSEDITVMGGFHDDLLPVRRGGKWGYMNKKGEMVIDFQYSLARPFSEGYAPVRLDETKPGLYRWALINKKNEQVQIYTGELEGVDHFHNNSALVNFSCDPEKDDNDDWVCSYGCVGMDGKLTAPVCGTMTTNSLPFR